MRALITTGCGFYQGPVALSRKTVVSHLNIVSTQGSFGPFVFIYLFIYFLSNRLKPVHKRVVSLHSQLFYFFFVKLIFFYFQGSWKLYPLRSSVPQPSPLTLTPKTSETNFSLLKQRKYLTATFLRCHHCLLAVSICI